MSRALRGIFSTITVLAILCILVFLNFGYHPDVQLTSNTPLPTVTTQIGSAQNTTTFKISLPLKYLSSKIIHYNRNGQNDDRSVFVVPRRVYYDNRVHQGRQRDAVLIAVEGHDDAAKAIVDCELNGYFSESISITRENIGWVRKTKPGYSHCAMLVECKGFPHKSIVNGSYPKLVYKRKGDNFYSFVESEMPLILRTFQSIPARGKDSAVVCTTLFGHPDNFKHWLKYQKVLGVDKVHINADKSFFKNSTVMYPFLKESLNNGFVEVEVWQDVLDNRMFNCGQMIKGMDCALRHINIFEYALFFDYDDYFNPILSNQKDIHFYLKQYFSKSEIGTVHLQWRQMHCGPSEEKCKTLKDGNLTSILSGPGSRKRPEAKCAHRVNSLMVVSVHTYQTNLPGYTSIRCNDKLAYIAHNRNNIPLCTT